MATFFKSVLIAIVLSNNLAWALDEEHLRLAMEFDSLSGAQDKSKLVSSLLPAFVSYGITTDEEKVSVKKQLIEILSSEEYLKGKAKVYMSIFSKQELRELIALVQLPSYQLMQNKRYAINSGLIENMQKLLSENTELLVQNAKSE